MDKKGVVMYYDLLEQLVDFTDEQFGRLVRVLLQYDKDGNIPEFDDMQLKLAFQMLKPTVDRNKEDYLTKCEKNRNNILKRWNKDDTSEYGRIGTNTIDTDNDIDKDIVIGKEKENNKKESTEWEDMFERLWKSYPNKKNKIQAKTTFEHKIRGLEKQERIDKCNAIYKAQTICIKDWVAYKTEKQFIPHYSSWLNANIPDSPKFKGRR